MTVNGKDYVVPMVLEEPSVVAAVGNVARMTRPEGFVAESDEPVMVWALFPHVSHVSSLLPSHENVRRITARSMFAATWISLQGFGVRKQMGDPLTCVSN